MLEVGHTHIKPVSYLYAIYAPWMWLYTRRPSERKRIRRSEKEISEIQAMLLLAFATFWRMPDAGREKNLDGVAIVCESLPKKA